MKEAIFKMIYDCGRMGSLEGTFVSTQEKVDKLIESKLEVYFGEVLGKHSEIWGEIEPGEITLVSDDPEFVSKFKGLKMASGYDPFDYTFISGEEEWEDATVDEYIEHLLKTDE